MSTPYRAFGAYLLERYGERLWRIGLDAGFTCPNKDAAIGIGGCSYCLPKALLPKWQEGGHTIEEQLKRGKERLKARRGAKRFIAYFQHNTNTYAPAHILKGLYKNVAYDPEVAVVAISTRPDCLGAGIIELLLELKTRVDVWVELGLQSANDETLKLINRGHTSLDFERAITALQESGIDVCSHVILGLPNEGPDDFLKTAKFLSKLKPWGIKLHQLDVVRGTPMEALYNEGLVRALGLDEYARGVVSFLEVMNPATVVHRLSGQTPRELLVAPKWGIDKHAVKEAVLRSFEESKTQQGARFEP